MVNRKARKRHPVAYIRDKIYIRQDIASAVDYDSIYDRHIFDERVCRTCPLKDARPVADCYPCRGLVDRVCMYETVLINNKPYIGVPWGDQSTVEEIFDLYYDEVDVVDQRSKPKMPYKLEWVQPLYTGKEVRNGKKTANQAAIVKKWLSVKEGIIEASPRTGKSVIAACIGTTIGLRVLIIAHESHLCHQMANEYVVMTNVAEVAAKNGLKIEDLILHIDTNSKLDIEKIKQACVVSVNYQKFIHTKQRIKLLTDLFGIIFVDECHQASATAFAQFLNSINARYRCGLSATTKRRDGRHVIGRMLIGPVTVKSSTSALIPTLTLIKTGINLPPSAPKPRDGGFKFLARSKTRNKLIVNNVMKDLAEGHPAVIVPVGFKYHIRELYQMFLEEFDNDRTKVIIYEGGVNKKDRLEKFESEGKVMIAQWSMIKQGVTLKKPTCMHLVLPRADGHMFYQLVNRICTPQLKKRKPVVRYYVDDLPLSHGSFKSVFWDEINKFRRGNKPGNPVRYDLEMKQEREFFDMALQSVESRKYNAKTKDTAPVTKSWSF